MGVAVLEGDDLVFWGVSGFRNVSGNGLLGTLERRLLSLIDIYQPNVLAVEQPTQARLRASPMLEAVAARVSSVALAACLDYRTCAPRNVRLRLCGSRKTSRRAMAAHVVSLYPHLARYFHCGSAWQQSYWMPMFTAVAVGLVCAQQRFH